jgi:P4 family phage/plasmid primase-like protien
MSMAQNSRLLNEFLKSYKSTKDNPYTHTRIPDKDLNIYGGTWSINENNLDSFWKKYYTHVFENHNKEYITEKQLQDNGPILIDIDMRYNVDIKNRQHTQEHIIDGLMCYMEKIGELMQVEEDIEIPIFVFEKSKVNITDTVTKDGIHILIGIKMDKILQCMLRNKVMNELKDIWDDLPLKNSWDEILDEGVTKGEVGWQMYGSRKPGNKAYMMKYHFVMKYNDNSWEIEENQIGKFNLKKNFALLSAQYNKHIGFPISDDIKEEYEILKTQMKTKQKKKYKLKIKKNLDYVDPLDIDSKEKLDVEIEKIFENLRPIDYELQETHNFTMILPETYWGAGSYNKWIKVGWALKNTSDKLFLTWIQFSSQSEEFSYDQLGELSEMWDNFETNSSEGLTKRSIMYWAKNDAYGEYRKVRRETVDFFIEETIGQGDGISGTTEFDFANVLFHIYKDKYVCISIKNNIWYEYINHRWFEIDSGNSLRLKISKETHEKYIDKTREAMEKLQTLDQTDDDFKYWQKRSNKFADIGMLLKKTTWKNNIMREARELFYDKDFINNLDVNPYLLCFNNGIIDFREKRHRKGLPEDYISKCTNIDYVKLDEKKHKKTIAEIHEFMDQLFPIPELKAYMWSHLASCLIGTNDNQTFNIYTGSGANGKSKLVDLISKGLGEYKGTVPITLVIQKRIGIGSTSSEVVQLQGTRYAVMQEPSKGDKINEGIMKEITGGDPIQCRALFKESITFIPQFKLIVTTNNLFDIKSNDDGTWRRIRVCDFKSKFTDKPYNDEDKFPKEHYPYQYQIDKKLDDKFTVWAPILISMLVEIAYKNQGNVMDCPMVMASSEQYREGQDYLAEFAKEHLQRKGGGKIKKTELRETFKQWYTTNYDRSIPKATELYEYMNKRYGLCKTSGWKNVIIRYDDADSEDDEMSNL